MELPRFYVDDIIKTALSEDINYIDSTTDLLIDPSDVSEAYFIAKAEGVVAGLDVALRVFELLDETGYPGMKVLQFAFDSGAKK